MFLAVKKNIWSFEKINWEIWFRLGSYSAACRLLCTKQQSKWGPLKERTFKLRGKGWLGINQEKNWSSSIPGRGCCRGAQCKQEQPVWDTQIHLGLSGKCDGNCNYWLSQLLLWAVWLQILSLSGRPAEYSRPVEYSKQALQGSSPD